MTTKDRRKQTHVVLGQWAPLVATVIFCYSLILGVMAYGVINTNNRARDVQNKQIRVAACILEQLSEHRVASSQHNQAVHDILHPNGPEYKSPEGVNPPPINHTIDICEEFFPNSRSVQKVVEESK